MEEFSPELKQRPMSEVEMFTHVETVLQSIIAMRVDQADGIGLSPVSKFPLKVEVLLQVGLRRTIELAEAGVREANRRNIVSSAVLTRAAFETACLLFDVMDQLEDIVAKDDAAALREFDKRITNTILGHGPKAKTFILAEEYVVQNILTIIQRLSKKHDMPLEGFYEGLCEYAHPNYIGMMGVYSESDHTGGMTTFTNARDSRANNSFLWMGALATGLDLVEEALKKWSDLVNRAAALAERRIYEEGTWPAGLEYPINRINSPEIC